MWSAKGGGGGGGGRGGGEEGGGGGRGGDIMSFMPSHFKKGNDVSGIERGACLDHLTALLQHNCNLCFVLGGSLMVIQIPNLVILSETAAIRGCIIYLSIISMQETIQ